MNSAELENIWNSIFQEAITSIPEQYHPWIKSFEPTGFENGIFTVVTDLSMAISIVRQHCLEDIQDIFKRNGFGDTQFQILLDKETTLAIRKENAKKNKVRITVKDTTEDKPFTPPPSADEFLTKMQSTGLNLKFKFENFVIGETNKTACAISRLVAEHPSEKYNPLFIYGGSGLGKTHLMQAIGRYHIFNRSKKRIKYIKTLDFINEYIENVDIRNKDRLERMSNFRQRFKNVDILLIDDIQFIESTKKFQIELFDIFETLLQKNKQIVLTSDRKPKDIPTLNDRLKSRFERGIVVDIKPPEFETRVEIIKSWVIDTQAEMPDDVIEYIAANFVNNVRELEGAFNKVTAFADIEKKKITKEFAEGVLNVDELRKKITIQNIAETVCEYYDITVPKIKSSSRNQKISDARKMVVYLAREMTNLSYEDIAKYLNKRHPTMVYSYDKIAEKLDIDSKTRELVRELKQSVRCNA